MKRVLFLSYYFPPIGGAGVQRSIKFVRYLREYGYEPVVVTGPGPEPAADRWSPLDPTLGGEVARDTDVLRIPTPEPPTSVGWQARIERWLRVQTPFSRWWVDGAVATGSRVRSVDLVYASMSPYETSLAAAALAQRFGVPWVADLRDPWALDEMTVYPSSPHRRLELDRMRRALAPADHVVMNTSEAAARLRRLPGFETRVISAIPNGYDADDFALAAPVRDDHAFRIVHTGYLHTQLGREHRRRRAVRRILGGAAPVDILTRSHVYLMEAIDRLRDERPELAAQLELHLVGLASDADRETNGSHVVFHGYVPHDESVAFLRSADLLFLPMQNLPPGERATIVPGKTYEYMAAQRPILAAVPDGDARDLLTEAGGVDLCRPDDVDAMAAALRDRLLSRADGRDQPVPNSAVVERFERRRLTAELAQVFDTVLGNGAARPREGVLQ